MLGAISALVLVCSSVAQVASRDRIAPEVAQAVGLGLLTAGLAALALASVSDSAVVLVAASVLAGTGHGLAFLGAQDDLNRIAPPERRGEINAALYTCIYVGIAVPVIGVGVLADLTSLVTAVNVFARGDRHGSGGSCRVARLCESRITRALTRDPSRRLIDYVRRQRVRQIVHGWITGVA